MAKDEEPREKRSRELGEQVGRQEARRLRARRLKGRQGFWSGLGMFGLVGWSVALPTLLGLALGLYLDSRFPGSFSWTLTLLAGGIIAGCLNAWFWVERERRAADEERKGGGPDE